MSRSLNNSLGTTSLRTFFSSSVQEGVAMTVTKEYLARNHGARDRIIEGLSFVVAMAIVALVLLFLAGGFNSGPPIRIATGQSPALSVDQ
jgi:hypothetical protein